MIIKKISKPGKITNEDCATVVTNAAWVLDGATGLNNKKMFHEESDAKGLVETYNSYLTSNISQKADLKKIVRNSIIDYSNKLEDYKIESFNSVDIPSSGAAIIRWKDSKVEYLTLGDCIILFQLHDGKIEKVYNKKLEKLDSMVLNEMKKLIRFKDFTASQALDECHHMLIKNRELKNTKNGYWVLGIDDNAVDNAEIGTINLSEVKRVILATDGFYALVNTYNKYNDSDLFKQLNEKSIDELYQELREIEQKDDELTEFIRFKKSDDASLIYIDFEND